MRGNHRPLFLVVLVLLVASLACTIGSAPEETGDQELSQDEIDTQVAATVEAQRIGTLTAAAAAGQAIPTDTQSPGEGEEDQTANTQTPTFTITPTQYLVPMVSVSTNTNCRYGPGSVYDPPVGALLVGESAEVVGIPPTPMNYIVIKNPDSSGNCWLWTEYATIKGEITNLPVFSVPPTPTPKPTKTPTPAGPQFIISYSNVHTCIGLQYATVKVRNTGSEIFESAQMYVVDLDTSTDLYGPLSNSAPFLADSNDCPPAGSTLNVNNSAFIAVSIGAAPPSGHTARFQVMLCTENGLGGDCKTHSVEFTIP